MLPIGLGVFAGVSVIALIVVGLVTYERTKYRKVSKASLKQDLHVLNIYRHSGNESSQKLAQIWDMAAWREYLYETNMKYAHRFYRERT